MPTSTLLRRLAEIYNGEKIRYPQLKAVTLAQWMLESGRASSELATKHYNFAGLKWRPEMAGFATKIRYQAHDGLDNYCKFATLEHFIGGYWRFISRAPYSGWETHVSSGKDYMNFIGPIYTPSADYPERVLALLPEAQALLYAAQNEPHVISTTGIDLGILVLDPGHGGSENLPGSSANNAVSVSGVKEKKLTLEFCLILRDLLLEQAEVANERLKIVLTRDGDYNLSGSERAGFAFKTMANALIVLHFNGSRDPKIRGAETFYRAASNGNLNLEADKAFATAVQNGLMEGLKHVDNAAVNRGVKGDDQTGPGALGLLNDKSLGNDRRARKCVAAYIEAEFITHPKVDRLLISGPGAIANRTKVLAKLAVAVRAQLKSLAN